MSVPDIIPDLVARFTDHVEDYKRGRYNETQLRREFLDPLFIALGWDVNNTHDGRRADVVRGLWGAARMGGAARMALPVL